MAKFTGTAGDDTITGTSGNDSFDMRQGGNDTVSGLAGRDVFIFGGTFTAADSINGGDGADVLRLNGDYSAGVTMTASTMTSVEVIQLDAGHSYNITTVNANIAPGIFKLTAGVLGASDTVTFNASAESDGRLALTSGAGNDVLTGGSLADKFVLSAGGNDTARGGGGNDNFVMGGALAATDKIDGGTGSANIVNLDGDYSAGVTFTATTMINVQTLSLAAGHDYNLTLNDGNVAANATLTVNAGTLGAGDTLNFVGAAESNGHYDITAGAGDDEITGGNNVTSFGDSFDFSKGGDDILHGGGGNDTVLMGASLTAADSLDGGGGDDTVVLDGDYSGAHALAMNSSTIANFAFITLIGGNDYDITLANGNVPTGKELGINAGDVGAGHSVVFNAGALTQGFISFEGGAGTYTVTGGKGADTFFDNGGTNSFTGGAGNDIFTMGHNFTAADHIDGGTGNDIVTVAGGGTLTLTGAMMANVEELDLLSNNAVVSFDYTSTDDLVAAGKTLFVNLSGLATTGIATFDGSAETDGHFSFTNNEKDGDVLTGGALSDTFNFAHHHGVTATGGGGSDSFTLASFLHTNIDTLVYAAVSDSTSTGYDTVTDMDFSHYFFHVSGIGAVTGIDPIVDTGSLSTATFDSDLASDVGAGDLAAHHAVLFTPDSGTLSGAHFLVIDENGTAGYQAGADLVIQVIDATGALSTSTFS